MATNDEHTQRTDDTASEDDRRDAKRAGTADDADTPEANPPRTTIDHVTAPKFGSAGSGGAELEPGPPRP